MRNMSLVILVRVGVFPSSAHPNSLQQLGLLKGQQSRCEKDLGTSPPSVGKAFQKEKRRNKEGKSLT